MRNKEYSIRSTTLYKPTRGLSDLISVGYNKVKNKGFKPRFLTFKGYNLSLGLNSNPRARGSDYFNPEEIEYIRLSIKGNSKDPHAELKQNITEYFLENRVNYMGLVMRNSKGVGTHSLSVRPRDYDLRGKLFNRVELSTKVENTSQKEFLKRVLEIIGVHDIKFGEVSTERPEWMKQDTAPLGKGEEDRDFVRGKYGALPITLDSVFSVYEFLLEYNKTFSFDLYGSIKGKEELFLSREEEQSIFLNFSLDHFNKSKIGISVYSGKKELEKELAKFEEFLSSVDGNIIFKKIIYDTRSDKQNEHKEEVLQKMTNKLNSGEISINEIKKLLEQEYYKIYKEGRTEKEAKEHAKSMAKLDFDWKIYR